jgi:hypothetical protein
MCKRDGEKGSIDLYQKKVGKCKVKKQRNNKRTRINQKNT